MKPTIPDLFHAYSDNEGAAVATEGLVKRFGPVVALDGLDLKLPDQGVYVLVGPNGAGKTTLLRVLMGLLRYEEGTASVLGLDPRVEGGATRGRIGYAPEGIRFGYPWMTVGRLLEHLGVFFPEWDSTYERHLTKTLRVKFDRKCGELSKGESRRVQLVQALAHRPALLILDEPMDGLDHVVREQTMRILSEHLADTPTTALISTHRVYEIDGLVDHVGVLKDGKLMGQLPRATLQQRLRRYRARVPAGWEPSPWLEAGSIRVAGRAPEIEWTVWGEPDRVRDEFARTGALINQVTALSIDEAAVALLAQEEEA